MLTDTAEPLQVPIAAAATTCVAVDVQKVWDQAPHLWGNIPGASRTVPLRGHMANAWAPLATTAVLVALLVSARRARRREVPPTRTESCP